MKSTTPNLNKRKFSDLDDDAVAAVQQPVRKRRCTLTRKRCMNLRRQTENQWQQKRETSENLLWSLFTFPDADSVSSEEKSMESVNDSDTSSPQLRTPRGAVKTYRDLTVDITSPTTSLSPNIKDSESEDSDDDDTTASLIALSENETFVIFSYLNFDEALTISKTCRGLHKLSFKVMHRMVPRCKSINGVTESDLTQLIGNCSDYLKRIDLTAVSVAVNDSVINTIGQCCTQLTHVSLRGCGAITDEGVISFLQQCSYIRELDLSGCYLLTSRIAPQLAKCLRLKVLNLSWCSNMDCDLIPYLLRMNEVGELRECWLHSTNRHVSLFGAFETCFDCLEQNKVVHRLNNPLNIKGGLQSKYTNNDTMEEQIEYLNARNILFESSSTAKIPCFSSWQFDHKMKLLKSSTTIVSWRLYTQPSSNKVYLVLQTEFGVFGTKLIPLMDFKIPRVE